MPLRHAKLSAPIRDSLNLYLRLLRHMLVAHVLRQERETLALGGAVSIARIPHCSDSTRRASLNGGWRLCDDFPRPEGWGLRGAATVNAARQRAAAPTFQSPVTSRADRRAP